MVFLKRELNMAKLFLIVVILVLAFGQLIKPFEAELSNHCRITQSEFMSEACRIGIAHRAAGQVAQASAKTNNRTVTSAPQLNKFPPRFNAAAS
jgi:hypothetical protein